MSKVRNRDLRRVGITGKRERRAFRRHILQYPKCNRKYAIRNSGYNYGTDMGFSLYGRWIDDHAIRFVCGLPPRANLKWSGERMTIITD